MRATFLTLFGVGAGTITSAGFTRAFDALLVGRPRRILAKKNVLGLRSHSFFVARIVVVAVVLVVLYRILFTDVTFDSTATAIFLDATAAAG